VRTLAAIVLLSATSLAAQSTCPPSPDYSYKGPHGPAHWVDQWPICGQGRAQSPIDIPGGAPVKGPAIEFHYQPFDLEVENTSHVIEVPAASGGYITVDGHRYDLQQFHFHTPSEHHIAGKAASLELHLVHKDAAGKLAVVGVLVSSSRTVNPALQPIVAALPVASCKTREPHAKFDAAALLPAARDYVTYGGSLTTPGCGEGVTWLVLEQPISASPAQVAKLGPFGVNARPVQPLNGRPIVHVKAGQ
jgi:carbonic anhydrase